MALTKTDIELYDATLESTDPLRLDSLSLQDRKQYHRTLWQLLPRLEDNSGMKQRCQERIALLRQEIQHQEVHGTAKNALSWARIGGVAGMVGGVAGIAMILVAFWHLIYDNDSSKVPPATSEQSPPPSSLQSQPPTSASSEPEASSSISIPSPQSTVAITPSAEEKSP